jgi:hypothetical protein
LCLPEQEKKNGLPRKQRGAGQKLKPEKLIKFVFLGINGQLVEIKKKYAGEKQNMLKQTR